MKNILDLANCATPDSVFNTGKPLCDVQKKKLRMVILMDRGVSFSGAEVASVASFLAALKTKTTAARGGRVYPISDLLNFEDNTGDPSTGGVGNLSTATTITNDAVPAFSLGYNGTEARHKRMSLMNGMTLDVMFVDAGFTVYGTDAGDGAIGGYNVLQAYADTSKFPVSDTVNQYRFRLTLAEIAQYRELSRYVVTNQGVLALQGLVNVTLQELSKAANVVKVLAIADGGTDLIALHGAAIAALPFTAVSLKDGAAVAVTSVAVGAAGEGLLVTLDNAAWGALAADDQVQIYGPSAAALAGAGVRPFEFISLIVNATHFGAMSEQEAVKRMVEDGITKSEKWAKQAYKLCLAEYLKK
jgi:hypothetical protein